jgi:hypothetical protein
MNNAIPRWITVVSILITLLGLFVGCSLYYAPGAFVKNIDFSSKEILFPAYMWAARQIAIALIIGYSVFRKSPTMLKISLIAYCLMTFQDIFIGLAQNDSGLIIGSSVFCVLSASIIYALSKKKSENN